MKKLLNNFPDEQLSSHIQQATTTSEWLNQIPPPSLEHPPIETRGDFVTIRATDGIEFAIYRIDSFQALLNDSLKTLPSRGGGTLSAIYNADESILKNNVIIVPIQTDLPNWKLKFTSNTNSDNSNKADREILLLVIIGVIVVALSFALSFALYRVMRRQADLTQLKNDLIATVSHELKTPIASIRLLIDVLQKNKSPNPDRVNDYLELISKENKRLGRLVENFLSFSRMERNKCNFDLQETSPEKIAQETKSVFIENLTNQEVHLELKIEDELRSIMADSEAIQTAIGNLLDNANKYGGPNAQIELSVKDSQIGIVFTISDKGDGIPKEEQSKIFERFYQSKRRLSEHAGGVGLGLSIVSFIVDGHAGKLDLVSNPGQGSHFSITIPHV